MKITPRKRIIEPHKLKFQKVQPDQALAPERQVVRDCLVAPLREEAMGLGTGAGQIAWGVGCQNRLLRSPGFAAADQFLDLRARVNAASEVQELRIGGCLDMMGSRG